MMKRKTMRSESWRNGRRRKNTSRTLGTACTGCTGFAALAAMARDRTSAMRLRRSGARVTTLPSDTMATGAFISAASSGGGHLPVEGGGQRAVDVTVEPMIAAAETPVGGRQFQHHGDAPALAVQLADIVGRDRMEAEHARVEAERAMGIVLEDIGNQAGDLLLKAGDGNRAHQGSGDEILSAAIGNHGEAADLGKVGPTDEILNALGRIERLQFVAGVDRDRRVVEDAHDARGPAGLV